MPAVTLETSPSLAAVRELAANEPLTGFYLVTRLEVKSKRDGGRYLELRLQDPSGSMDGRMWEDFEELLAELKPGDAVKLQGVTNDYHDVRSLKINRLRKAKSEEVADPALLLPRSPLSPEAAREQLSKLVDSISNEHFRRLLTAIFGDEAFMQAYLQAPAGKHMHHAEIGGLAQHTVTLARVADCVCQFYPQLNHDLLVTGALLHDIGKVFELAAELGIDYTVDGRLLGHIFMGAAFVEDKISRLPAFPVEIRRQVLHMILAHQGDGSMGSPVKPMTLESLVVHYLDELDSKIEAFLRVRAATPGGQLFSDYVRPLERFLYLQAIDAENSSQNGGSGHE